VAVSKNNVFVAVGGADKSVRLYTLADAKAAGTFPAPAAVHGLAFSPNNQSLAAACEDGAALSWNVVFNPGQPTPPDFGKPLQSFAHGAAATEVAFAPDNITLYTGSLDKTARVWKFAADAPTKNLGHPNMVDAVAWSPDGKQLATGCHDGIVRIWDVAKGTVMKQTAAHQTPAPNPMPAAVYSVAWSPDGKQVVSASYDQSLKLWDAAAGTLVREFKPYKVKDFEKGHREGVFSVAFSPDGKTIASGSSDRTIKIWNVADGAVLRDCVNPNLKPGPEGPVAHPGWVYSLRFTADGKYLLSAGPAPQNHGFLAAWQAADGKMIYGEELPLGPFHSLALAPNGKLLAVASGGQGRMAQEVNSYILKMPDVIK
jgi:WD40 repeat protein